MRWLYALCWVALAVCDVPALWRSGQRRVLALWLSLAVMGAGLGLWYFWGHTQWRLAEWVFAVRN